MTGEPMRDPVPDPLLTPQNCWEDIDFRRNVEATGPKKLVMAALWTEVCLAFPALGALREGYEVHPVVDAVGGTSPEAHRAGLERIGQAGAQPIGWASLACELQGATGLEQTPFPKSATSCSLLDSAKGSEPVRRSIVGPSGRRYLGSPGRKLEALTPHAWFVRRVLEVGGHVGQGFRDSLERRCIDAVEEATPNASEVNRPCGLQFGHAPRSKPRNVAPRVRGACRFRHEAARLEIVHQASHPARRQVGGVGQVGHPQLTIGSFGKVHDRRVLARRQASASDQVAVQMSRDDLDNSHHRTPELFLGLGEWLDRGHSFHDILLRQAIFGPSAATRSLNDHLTRRTPTFGGIA